MRRKYPWEQWFGRSRTVILRGVHYRCSQSTMVQSIRNEASQRGLRAPRFSVSDTDTEITIEIKDEKKQAVPDVRGTVLGSQAPTA